MSPLKIGLSLVKKIIEIIMKKAGADLKAIKRLGANRIEMLLT